MKRVTLGSAFTIAGVLSAGAAAALVNTRVLETAGGDATGTNQVALEEARDTPRAWSRLTLGVPTPTATAPPATALGGESGVFTEDASGAEPLTSAVGALEDATPRVRAAPTTGATSRATRTAPPATTTTSVPPASTVPTTTAAPAPATASSSSPPSPSTTITTIQDDAGRNENLDWAHWFPGASTTTTVPRAPEPPPEPTTTSPGPRGPTTEPPPTTEPEDPPTSTSTTFPPDD